MSRRRLKVLHKHFSQSSNTEQLAWDEPAVSYSTGMFRPVEQEADDIPCVVEGCLPADLVGTYFRNGPNARFPAGHADPFHYFDGDGMIAAFRIDATGHAFFSHKWVCTERLKSDTAKGKSLYEFGSLSAGKLVGHLCMNEDGERMGKANTSLLLHHRRFFALEDADLPYRINLPSLQTVGRVRFHGKGQGSKQQQLRVFTAHPKVCAHTGELVGYGCEYTPHPQWVYTLLSKHGRILRSFPISLRHTSYNHDCAATRNFSVVFDCNLVLSWENVVGMTGGSIWKFRRDIPGRIGVFPRHASDESAVRWFDVEPFCVSHAACAWDEIDIASGAAVVVVITNNIGQESFAPRFPVETPRDPDANLHEYRFNLGTGEVKERALMRLRSDFPTTHGAWAGKDEGNHPRFVYAALLDYQEPNHAPVLYGMYKYDLVSGTCKKELWSVTDDESRRLAYFGGEPCFAPRPNPCAEDDGYVLVLVNDSEKRRSELRIFDAQRFGSGGALLATIICPRRVVPLGTHGLWLDEATIAAVE